MINTTFINGVSEEISAVLDPSFPANASGFTNAVRSPSHRLQQCFPVAWSIRLADGFNQPGKSGHILFRPGALLDHSVISLELVVVINNPQPVGLGFWPGVVASNAKAAAVFSDRPFCRPSLMALMPLRTSRWHPFSHGMGRVTVSRLPVSLQNRCT